MGLVARRKVLIQKDKHGRVKSKSLSIPLEIETGVEHTMAADALILSDPTGVLTKEELSEMLDLIEPIYWRKKLKKEISEPDRPA